MGEEVMMYGQNNKPKVPKKAATKVSPSRQKAKSPVKSTAKSTRGYK